MFKKQSENVSESFTLLSKEKYFLKAALKLSKQNFLFYHRVTKIFNIIETAYNEVQGSEEIIRYKFHCNQFPYNFNNFTRKFMYTFINWEGGLGGGEVVGTVFIIMSNNKNHYLISIVIVKEKFDFLNLILIIST